MNGVSGPRYNGRFIALVGCLFAATCLLFAGVCPRDASGQSSPVMRVGGVTTLNGQPAPVGTTITAMIGTVVCGTASVREGGAYEMTVASAATVPGCGTDDATVTFTVGGTRATQTISWRQSTSTDFTPELNLTAQAATPTPAPSPTATRPPTPMPTRTAAPSGTPRSPSATPAPPPPPPPPPTPMPTPAATAPPTPVPTTAPTTPAPTAPPPSPPPPPPTPTTTTTPAPVRTPIATPAATAAPTATPIPTMTPDPAATPTPAPTPESTATPEPTPQALASDFDASDSRRDGTIAFNPPARMRVGEATRVQARISPKTTEAIERQITEKMKGAGAGQPQTRPVKITAVMSLRLSGRDFSITSYSDDKQKIFDPFTTWEWDIAPTSPGTKQLSLTIVTYVEGGDATISAVEDWTVEVDVTIGHRIGEFMTKYWQWMATAVIFPLGIWVTNFVLRRRRNAPTG